MNAGENGCTKSTRNVRSCVSPRHDNLGRHSSAYEENARIEDFYFQTKTTEWETAINAPSLCLARSPTTNDRAEGMGTLWDTLKSSIISREIDEKSCNIPR